MRSRRAAVAVSMLLLAACSSRSSSDPSPAARVSPPASASNPSPPAAVADWPTYHGRNDRAGAASVPALRPPLRRAWSVAVRGALYAQPIVADGVVIAATENDDVYAVDLATGRVRWHRHLATPTRRSQLSCGNIDPSGITGTPAYDASTHQVFVATESGDARHTLVALDLRTGATRWQHGLDLLGNRDRHAQQQRGALLVASGKVYIAFGGRFGDCGNYVGYLVGIATDGHDPVDTYAVPTAREAGMWAAPGPVTGPGGDIYVATGNGAEVGGRYDDSDSVLALSSALRRLALFAPLTWRGDNAQDLDLGSMSPAIVGSRIVIAGKRGTVYLLGASLGGVGGQLAAAGGCAAYGGAAVRGRVVFLPCNDGLRALRVTGSSMSWLWHNGDLAGSPVTADGAGYAFAGSSLAEFDLASGQIRARLHVGDVTRFTTPVPAGSYVVVGTTSHLVAVTGSG